MGEGLPPRPPAPIGPNLTLSFLAPSATPRLQWVRVSERGGKSMLIPVPAVITIHIDPVMFTLGPLTLTWHGLTTFLGILTVVVIGARRGRRMGISEDAVYNIAAAGLAAGIIGARLVHVIDFWTFYVANPLQIFNIVTGGIGLIGGIIGATIGGAIAMKVQKVPLGMALDAVAPAVPLGQMVGRIGDIINGEHIANAASLPWAFVYSHPGSPSFGLPPQHPAIAYEMLWDVAIAAVLFWLFGKVRPAGMLFALYAVLYAVGRFTIQFVREDAPYIAGLQEAHLLTLAIMAVAIPILVARMRPALAGVDVYAEDKARAARAAADAEARRQRGGKPPATPTGRRERRSRRRE